ncbi:uncharacterized protein LOC129167989 [Dunckerocampus dactyliophorus]|uniref:uncharacterized protein LOC129167989 n=1 Tax=Dunckerocampus dactyliophorus TaxID=161453 RepID=UPI002406DA40|nr:uncharacterized protein LOC129167989 [Dunckerocampus dactyliophorus]
MDPAEPEPVKLALRHQAQRLAPHNHNRTSSKSGDSHGPTTHAAAFRSERARVAFVMSHLSGRAGAWATAEWSRQSPLCSSYSAFAKAMEQVFQRTPPGRDAARSLLRLCQGRRCAADYAIEFRALAAQSDWNASALLDAFFMGLSDPIKDQMVPLEAPTHLDDLIALAIRIEKRLKDRRVDKERAIPSGSYVNHRAPPTPPRPPIYTEFPPAPKLDEPMQLEGSRLTPAERNRRKQLHLCIYCGQAGHPISRCPVRPDSPRSQASRSSPPRASTDTPSGMTSSFEPAGRLQLPDCAIDLLPGAPFPSSRLYNVSKPEREALELYISTSLAAGLIRPSTSQLAAGFFFVEKKDKSLRPCIDYRALNDITVKNKYPLPLMDSAFNSLHSAKIFTKLDLRSAYHLVRVREGDEWKTAFNTPLGHFEYLVMPFGLTNAPAVFQSLINDVLQDMLGRFIFVYLDDILIFSSSLKEHIQHVRLVLQRLLENTLFVKAEKCSFHSSSVSFLGFIVEQGQLSPDPAKIQAVVDWPAPTSRKLLQRFLGFANFYRRFIRNFSLVAEPLTKLTSVKVPFVWTPEADSAFNRLKSLFTTAPVLTHLLNLLSRSTLPIQA